MTFRELLNKSSYKSVFNILYKQYYKDKPESEVQSVDMAYLDVWNALLEKKYEPNKEYSIYIRKITEDFDHSCKPFIDVCLYCHEDDKTYAIDLMPWDELIDAKIKNGTRLRHNTILAHILWEITFYGFNEESIKFESEELKKQIERIESGEEELIPWDEAELE